MSTILRFALIQVVSTWVTFLGNPNHHASDKQQGLLAELVVG